MDQYWLEQMVNSFGSLELFQAGAHSVGSGSHQGGGLRLLEAMLEFGQVS